MRLRARFRVVSRLVLFCIVLLVPLGCVRVTIMTMTAGNYYDYDFYFSYFYFYVYFCFYFYFYFYFCCYCCCYYCYH